VESLKVRLFLSQCVGNSNCRWAKIENQPILPFGEHNQSHFYGEYTMNKKITWILVLVLLLVGVTAALASDPGWTGEPTGAAANQPENWEAWAAANGEIWICAKTDDPDFTVIDGLAYYTMPAPDPGYMWRLLVSKAGQVNLLHWNPVEGGQYASDRDSISHVILCQMLAPCEWEGETAWAHGPRYEDQGNWATYTSYVPNSTVILYAGQTMDAGTVHFSEAVDGFVTITITLNGGWRFFDDPGMENVKIQDYENAPSGNPAPGGFDHKGYATGSPFSIEVPANSFYGVHVDVEWERCQ
jgi:hypothetical protein